MGESNIVTITVDEYFELRQKAEMNMTMLREIAGFEARLNDFAERLFEFDRNLNELARGCGLNGKNNN